MSHILVVFVILASGLSDDKPGRPSFEYDAARPLELRQLHVETQEDVTVRDVEFAGATGRRMKGYLVSPARSGRFAGILYVHWLGTPGTSNRTQFLPEARKIAHEGAVSLLIDAMWSEPQWFEKRDPGLDYENSVQQVKELRRALDVLAAQPEVDPARIAYVGNDFGAMCGAVLSAIDRRPRAWALQAGTTSFSSWYLLGRRLNQAQRDAVVRRLGPLDPVRYIGEAAPAAVLMQFGSRDGFVPADQAREFAKAAREPKRVLWYDGGHELCDRAAEDRMAWLRAQLGLHSPPATGTSPVPSRRSPRKH